MKKMKSMLLSVMLVVVMVVCSACIQADVQVKVEEDGSSKVRMETLIGKSELEMLKPVLQKKLEEEMGAEMAEQQISMLFGQIETCEVITVEGKEYYKYIDENSFNDEEELEIYLLQNAGLSNVSVGKDHFYAAMVMGDSTQSAASDMGITEEEINQTLSELGLTQEQLVQMLAGAGVKLTMEFPANITYSNGEYEQNSNKVTWDFGASNAQQGVNEEVQIFYAETMENSVLKADTAAPKISGIKNKGYYKNATVKVTDTVGLAGMTVDGLPMPVYSGMKIADIVGKEGKHTLKAYDFAGNKTVVTFTYDKTKPVVKGVANKKTYKAARTIKFSDKYGIKSAKLNGKTIKTNKKVNKKGSYTLKVTDKAGNTTTVKFKIKK